MKRKKKDKVDHLDDIDVAFDPKPLTDSERKMLSTYFEAERERSVTRKRVKLEVGEPKAKYKSGKTKAFKQARAVKRVKAAAKKKKQ